MDEYTFNELIAAGVGEVSVSWYIHGKPGAQYTASTDFWQIRDKLYSTIPLAFAAHSESEAIEGLLDLIHQYRARQIELRFGNEVEDND